MAALALSRTVLTGLGSYNEGDSEGAVIVVGKAMAVNPRMARGHVTERLRMTVEEYLIFEAMSQEKHEYVSGWVYALYPEVNGMAGGTNNHAALASNVCAELSVALRQSHCVVYNSDVRVQVNATDYRYPDAAVSCDSRDLTAGEERRIRYPSVLVEVLSETTEESDRGPKLAEYRSMSSVQDYLLVNSMTRLVEHYHRAGDLWIYRTYGPQATITLDNLGVLLSVDDIYAKVRLPDSPASPTV